jgi:hypothetical protein
VRVQSLSGAREVKPGENAGFVIWVWSTGATSRAVTVRASAGARRYVSATSYTVCPVPEGTSCAVGDLPVGQAAELQAVVSVRSSATVGGLVKISAEATASGAQSFTGTASDVVVAADTAIPSSSAPGSLPPETNLPTISGTGVSPTDPSGLFPTVQSSPLPSSTPGLPSGKARTELHVADAAATVPLDARLIGGQLAGLAVLAGAVTIAIARLSFRTSKPTDGAGATTPKS